MSEAEKQTVQENLDKDDHCYLAWKMDLKFREILNKKTPNYLQHLKSLPSHDATDSIYQRTKWSHNSMHPPPVHNFLKKLKGFAENPDWKSDGVSDTDSVRTEDFESRFTELLVPVSSIGSESQDTIDAADGADIDDCNDIPIGEKLLEGVVSIDHPPVASADSSDAHKWKNPTVAAKQRYEPDLTIPKSFNKDEVKNPVSKKEQIPDTETQKIENHNISSTKLETTKFDESLESFQPLPECSHGKLWQLINEMPAQADKNQTFQENILKQKVEQLVGENIKLGAEKALLTDELKEMKDKREYGAASKLKKLQENYSKLRADNHVLASNSTELKRKLDDQLKNVSELKQQKNQYSNRIVQLENNNQILTDNIAKLNKQLEQNAVKITDLEDQVKDLKEQLHHEKELYQTEKQEHLKSMTILEKQSKESLSQLQNDHKQELEKLKSASNAEQDALVEKYELRLAKQVAAHTSEDAIKESQISSLKSNLVKLKSEQECERQRWKQILAKNDDSRKKKKERCQPVDSEVTDQPQNHNKELHDQLERANKQISNLNTINQQLYLRIGHLREELSKLREVYKPWEEEGSWEISGTRDIRAHPNQLMIQNLKDKITKEMHIEVLSLMQRLHQQEDELVYIKSMWNKMLKNLHLFERDGNNSTVFDTDKLEILIASLLNEESHLNMNILGIKYLSRLTTSVCGRPDNGKGQPPLIDKPTVAQYLHEPIKTAFTRLHSTTQQLRDLVKSLSKMDLQNPSLQLYSARQTDSIRSEFTTENANQEKNVFRPFIGISSSSYGCSANGFDEESQRMILLECDLNHQAKVLLELMRSYNGLQEALVASHSSRQTQKEMRRNGTTE